MQSTRGEIRLLKTNSVTRIQEGIDIGLNVLSTISDFKTLKGSRVVILTEDGSLQLYQYDIEKKTSSMLDMTGFVRLTKEQYCKIAGLEVEPQTNIALVKLKKNLSHRISVLKLFQLPKANCAGQTSIRELAVHDLSESRPKMIFHDFKIYGYLRGVLLLVGVNRSLKRFFINLFGFDGNQIDVLKVCKVPKGKINPSVYLFSFNEQIYGCDCLGQVFKVKVNHLKC